MGKVLVTFILVTACRLKNACLPTSVVAHVALISLKPLRELGLTNTMDLGMIYTSGDGRVQAHPGELC
jgi:hypothetical protein